MQISFEFLAKGKTWREPQHVGLVFDKGGENKTDPNFISNWLLTKFAFLCVKFSSVKTKQNFSISVGWEKQNSCNY